MVRPPRAWPRLTFEEAQGSLKNQGIDVPEYYLSEEGMVEWLWTYDSKI